MGVQAGKRFEFLTLIVGNEWVEAARIYTLSRFLSSCNLLISVLYVA